MAKRTKRLTSQGEEPESIRINKFLSDAGMCSRREADRYITEGVVKIDGVVAEMGSRVTKDSQVTFYDKPVKREEKLVLIAFNKPEGIVCTSDSNEPDNIIDYINYGMRIYPIGRLDKDSEGLILLTNDGNIVNKILRAENKHEKEYVVTVNKEINAEFMKGMSSGVPILDTVTNPCTLNQIDKYTFHIILTQGLNRQIRRMCEYFGYRVVNLKRIRIMNIQLGRLKTGDYRNVTEKEIADLNESFEAQNSSGMLSTISQGKLNSTSEEAGRKTVGRNPEAGKPEARKAEGRRTEGRKPEGRKAEAGKAEGRKAEGRKAEGRKPEGRKPEGRKPEGRKAEGRKVEARKAEGLELEARKPEARKSEARNPEARKPEARKSEARNPEVRNPDSRRLNIENTDRKTSAYKKSEQRTSGGRKPEAGKLGSGTGDNAFIDEKKSTTRSYNKKVSLKDSKGPKNTSYSPRENRPRKGYKPMVDFNRGNVSQSRYGNK